MGLIQSDWSPYKMRSSAHRHTQRDDHVKAGRRWPATCKPGTEATGETNHVNTLILNFQPLGLQENKLLLFRPLRLWYLKEHTVPLLGQCRSHSPAPQCSDAPACVHSALPPHREEGTWGQPRSRVNHPQTGSASWIFTPCYVSTSFPPGFCAFFVVLFLVVLFCLILSTAQNNRFADQKGPSASKTSFTGLCGLCF